MKKDKSKLMVLLTLVTIVGNYLFILWILYIGIAEGFKEITFERISLFTLIALLAVDASLLIGKLLQQQKGFFDENDD